jgi:hypothetical protein
MIRIGVSKLSEGIGFGRFIFASPIILASNTLLRHFPPQPELDWLFWTAPIENR